MDDHSKSSVGAQRAEWEGPPPATFPRGRRCAEPGCETVLSVYNGGQLCSHHAIGMPTPRRHRHRRAS